MQIQVDLTVEDVGSSVDFYRKAGIELPDPWDQDGAPHHVEAEGLMLNSRSLTRSYDPSWPDSSGVVLIVSLPDRAAVDSKHDELVAAGHHSHLAPIDAFWGARYAIVDDPDGNHVGLMSPSDRAHGQTPTL